MAPIKIGGQVKRFFITLFCYLAFNLHAIEDYVEPKEVATLEGLPSSLVDQSVCAISGEYTDTLVDLIIPGPEPLVFGRVYTSFSNEKSWWFNHCDRLIVDKVHYEGIPSYLIAFRRSSGAQIDYIYQIKEEPHQKKVPFTLVVPKGLTNGATILSGRTHIKNQSLHFYPEEEIIVSKCGAGNRKTFKKTGKTNEGLLVLGQIDEEKVNGSRIRYEGKGFIGAAEIICENKKTGKQYSTLKFSKKFVNKDLIRQKLTTSDGRKLNYFFKRHHYRVKEKQKHEEASYTVEQFYLSKVEHPYAPNEDYLYSQKALSQDLHITSKQRDEGRRFLNIEYYHQGINHVGGEVGAIDIKSDDDFRLDRVKKLQAPVGCDLTPITTHRFEYFADISKSKIDGHKKIGSGHTDIYDAQNHKTRYCYDKEHRLTSIIRYLGTSSYQPYAKECLFWDSEGSLISKVLKDGQDHIQQARTFTYDSYGNVTKSTLCGTLTGKSSSPLLIQSNGTLVENGYERESREYTYSNDGLNLLLTETDSSGKTTRYEYKKGTDHLKAKFISYDGQIRIREFYFYDDNYALTKKIIDDGRSESSNDLSYVTERHYTHIVPRTEAPVGLPQSQEEGSFDFQTQRNIPLKRSLYTYSPEGYLLKEECFDANGALAYTLQYSYDSHGNLISETDPMGITTEKKYDPATDNLIEQIDPDITLINSYDFADRLIEQKEIHPNEELTTHHQFDALGNCISTTDPYGHETRRYFDDFGRVIEIHYPPLPKEGTLVTPIAKTSYDISSFPIQKMDPNGELTSFQVNIRGQPIQITYPDGTQEKMIYSLDGKLLRKTSRDGIHTEYIRDPLGRILQETIIGEGIIKKTLNHYNAFHLIESIDPEGNSTTHSYDTFGRLKEIIKNDQKTQQFYDSLGRISQIREYYGHQPDEYRITLKKYDNRDRIIEESLQTSEGKTLHYSAYEYDVRGNQTLIQVGDQKTFTQYDSQNRPIKITNALGYETHIEYNPHFINPYNQKVLQKITTDPLGYRTQETYDSDDRLIESIRLNPIGEKVLRKIFFYDLLGNLTKIEEEVIEERNPVRAIVTNLTYNPMGQLIQIQEAAGTTEQKNTYIRYNSFGQKETLIKPDGTQIHYTYDSFARLKTQTSSDKTLSYLYEYNLLDHAIRITDQNTGKVTECSYFQGRLEKETLANGLTLNYTYDRTGRARTITFPDGTGLEYVYNAVDLQEIHRLIDKKRTYSHFDTVHSLSGQILQANPPGNNSPITYCFDPLDRCLLIDTKDFSQQVPKNGFDPAGNLLQFELQKTPFEFTYDDNYQIKSEKGHSYSFDSLSNRMTKDGEKYQYNALNQLIKKGEERLLYDLNGNLIKKGSFEYSYDALDRLTQVTCEGKTTTYTYDSFNRRLSKNEELFLYQGQDEIGCWKNGQCQEIRLLGKNRQSRTIALEIQGIPYVPIHDMSGNIALLLNLQGEPIEHYRYTVYGEGEIFAPDGQKLEKSAIGNYRQNAGKRIDEESGLIPYGMRYYDPSIGRWTTPDPAGFIDGSNLYAFVHNNPLQYIDQYGLFAAHNKFCSPLIGFDNSPVTHVNIEDEFADHYHLCRKTGIYSANDFINPQTAQHYNFKEFPPDKMMVFANGICNTFRDFEQSLLHLANLSGYNIRGIFCPTLGFALDVTCFKKALFNNHAYEGVRAFQKMVREFDAKSSPGATMLVKPHSRSTAYIKNGLRDLSKELRSRVEVRAFASGAYIDDNLCASVVHYESKNDPIPFLDFFGRMRCRDTIVRLNPHKNASWFDHSITSWTFINPIRKEDEEYMER